VSDNVLYPNFDPEVLTCTMCSDVITDGGHKQKHDPECQCPVEHPDEEILCGLCHMAVEGINSRRAINRMRGSK